MSALPQFRSHHSCRITRKFKADKYVSSKDFRKFRSSAVNGSQWLVAGDLQAVLERQCTVYIPGWACKLCFLPPPPAMTALSIPIANGYDQKKFDKCNNTMHFATLPSHSPPVNPLVPQWPEYSVPECMEPISGYYRSDGTETSNALFQSHSNMQKLSDPSALSSVRQPMYLPKL